MSDSKNLKELFLSINDYFVNEVDEIINDNSQKYISKYDNNKFSMQPDKKTIAKNIENSISKDNHKITENLSNNQFLSINQIVDEAKKIANIASNLIELKMAVSNFENCGLKKMATNTVFADGNPNAKIMVIGEAPGNNEDLQGIPFCGDSGKLLDEAFKAINLERSKDYYITNVIFWRPPGNRPPTSEELAICRPFVERHIELLNPEILILVGSSAMNSVLQTEDKISSIRGKIINFAPKFLTKSIPTMTVFHPSYLMRQPTKKKLAWLDFLALEKFLIDNNIIK
ncbi:MAG: uracil-DNA glycosylase [Rickettsiales bacterium]|jgi:DNA polymerase|nr:uracil-DNA glycosylase [Rickettsiales bacterium]